MPDDGWLAAYQAASQRARQAWADDAKLDALVEVPWGKIPASVVQVPPDAAPYAQLAAWLGRQPQFSEP